MRVAVIADAHIGGEGGPPQPLVGQLAELPGAGCDRLVLLGDLFQVWVGAREHETGNVRAVVAALRELRRRGVRIDYIEGNRDFFLAGSPYAELFETLGPSLAFEVAGVRYLAVHGDGLDAADRQYRFWRALSKSRLSRAVWLTAPAALTRPLVERTERRLAKTNFKHKIQIPEEAILAFARRRLEEGFDRVLLGHFHEPRRWTLPGGEVRILDAWFNSRRVEWLGDAAERDDRSSLSRAGAAAPPAAGSS